VLDKGRNSRRGTTVVPRPTEHEEDVAMSALIERECRAAELRRQDLLREAARWRQFHEIQSPQCARTGRLRWPWLGRPLPQPRRASAT
jgi:hypothetical protein